MKILQNPITSISISILGGPLGAAVGQALNILGGLSQMQGAMQQLQGLLGSQAQPGLKGAPAQPQPFSSSQIMVAVQQAPIRQFQTGNLQQYGKPPIVGSDAGWKGFSDSINQRITGSASNTNGLFDGSNPWAKGDGRTEERAAVGWTMQQNDNLRYDADRKMFYTTDQNGVTRDAMSLDQVIQTMRANGGANPNNGAGFQAVGQLANQMATPPTVQSLQQLLQQLQKMLSGMKPGTGLEAMGASNGFSNGAANGAANGGGYSAPSSNAISAGGGSGSASGGGSLEDSVAAAGSKIDDMFAQAEKLMASDKPSDQLKAQMMMQKAQRMFESISKLLEQRSKAQSTAISNIK